jgi:Zn-dependent protease with chaperone function
MGETTPPKPTLNDSPRVKGYHRARRVLSIVDFAVSLALLLALLFAGWSVALRTFAQQVNSSPGVSLLIYLVLLRLIFEAPGLPLSYARAYWLEHRYGLSNLTPSQWLKDHLKGSALGGALVALGLEFAYWTVRRWPAEWWILSSAVFICFFILLTNLAPVLLFPLFFRFKPLEDSPLTERLVEFSRHAGKQVRGVYEWKLSEKSKKANAALVGLGNTRRFILSDTLIQSFTPEEVEAVLAHEFGHHVRGHIARGIAVQSLTTFLGFYLVDAALRAWEPYFGYRGLADFANLPLLALVTMGVSLAFLPLMNSHSRWMERQADAYALESIPDRTPFISSMEKLAELNLAERRPARWIEFVFHSHPSIESRIAMAKTQNA